MPPAGSHPGVHPPGTIPGSAPQRSAGSPDWVWPADRHPRPVSLSGSDTLWWTARSRCCPHPYTDPCKSTPAGSSFQRTHHWSAAQSPLSSSPLPFAKRSGWCHSRWCWSKKPWDARPAQLLNARSNWSHPRDNTHPRSRNDNHHTILLPDHIYPQNHRTPAYPGLPCPKTQNTHHRAHPWWTIHGDYSDL